MSDQDRYLFTIRVDITPEHERAFNEWYNDHVRELLEIPGFISGRRYRAIEARPMVCMPSSWRQALRPVLGRRNNWFV